MVKSCKALNCFIGAWVIINATLTNKTTDDPIPEWHSVHPGGISLYTQSGYSSFTITANDTTQSDFRPRELSLPAHPNDPDSRWALVGKHSLTAGGPFELSCEPGGHWGHHGPAGYMLNHYTTATLPSWVGVSVNSTYNFYNTCKIHVLLTSFGDLLETVYYRRLPDHTVPIPKTESEFSD
ncbi:hypothetical protein GQX73_g4485 [Xylaria multiplex]|uniref:Lipocalin-like domain-containing protein n=1 Tax=Xylaria multiplex TaxID=323545 RepID=A0A7C8MTI3_9PEZI|nr:hypothetical protein GQX73_g4485 [Xylaria multiplex]